MLTDVPTPPKPARAPADAVFAFPASYAQERLWFFDQVAPHSALYNSAMLLHLQGDLDVAAFHHAFTGVVHRHDALRTTFAFDGARLTQRVAESLEPRFLEADVSHLDIEARDAEAQRLVDADVREPFDLATGPLVRALLIRLGDADYWLALTVHHIVADGWSMRVIFEELSALYAAFVTGRPSPLAPVAIQYPDFAVWQREWLRDAVLDQQLAFWRDQLASPLAELTLPGAHPAATARSFRGALHTFTLERDLARALTDLARAEGASLFMLLLAAFDVLLHRSSGDVDIRVGAPIANRDRPEIERAVGFFANTVVFRADLSGDPTFRALLRRVRETALAVYQHQDAPFQKVVEAVRPARDAGRNLLVQTMIALQPAIERALHLDGIAIDVLPVDTGTAKFDLELEIQETSDGLRGTITYSTDLFDADAIARLAEHFRVLLDGISATPDCPISTLPLLTAHERRRVLVDWNPPPLVDLRDACIHERFEQQAARTPAAIAIEWDKHTMTYDELRRRARMLAGTLRALGVAPGSEARVGVVADRSPEFIVAILGVLEAGGAYVPLDVTYPAERLAFMLADAGVRVLLAPDRRAPGDLEFDGRIVSLAEIMRAPLATASDSSVPPVAGDTPAYVMYTSGSTGRPKGVVIPHRSVCALAADTTAIAIGPADRIAHVSNTSFDAATFEIWGALLNGARVVVIPRATALSPVALSAELATREITIMFLTTALFNQMAREVPRAFGRLRALLVGGEALDPPSVSRVLQADRPLRFINGYGPTETTTFATMYVVHEVPDNATRIPIGRPLGHARAYVLDQHRQPVGVGVIGELYIGGTGVGLGYLNRPDLTAARFLPDPFAPEPGAQMYRTGDRVRLLPGGDIDFLGRIDRQMKLRGFRIEPDEIEAVLRQHPAVRDAIVTLREDEPGQKRLVAYVVRATSVERAALRAHLAGQLPDYMIPAAIVFLDALPLSANGKVDHRALPAPEQLPTTAGGGAALAQPRDMLEMQLALLWERVLGVRPIGIRDNFFDLGGHSLLAASLLAEVAKWFGQYLPLVTLFRAPTVELLADILREERDDALSAPLVLLRPGKDVTRAPLVLVHRAGAHLLVYRTLVMTMPEDQPVYGLQAPGHERMQPIHSHVEEMAAHYVAELRRQWPDGPYHLGGSSFGGIVAFEMARQLQALGAPVGLLVMFDTYPTDVIRWLRKTSLQRNLRRLARQMARRAQKFALMSNRERIASLALNARTMMRGAARLARREAKPLPPASPKLNPVVATFYRAMDEYEMRPFPGRMLLFRAASSPWRADVPPDFGWGRWTTGGVTVEEVPGTHLTMLEEPHVRLLAERLDHYLRGSSIG